jgi:uncharacterized membrane protein YcaP (DUF421 family)
VSDWFGASWGTIGFVVVSTVAMYATLLLAVRIAGRRTVAQLSAFDVIVTVALGTLLSSTVVQAEPSYLQATSAVVTLLSLQVIVAAARRHSALMRRVLEFEPEVIVRDGSVSLPTGLMTSQLSEGELHSRLRQQGIFDLENVVVVVLEPSGHVSVARPGEAGGDFLDDDSSSLHDET